MAGTAAAQNPLNKLTYEERGGTAGRSLVVDGKSFGPYKDFSLATLSTSGTTGLFFATKRDKTYVVAQGREWGPLTAGYDTDVSDDGKVWAVSVTREIPAVSDASEVSDDKSTDDSNGGDSATTTQILLWVNGKSYGPYQSLYDFQYAETGGAWIANLRVNDDESVVLLNGKEMGTFPSVDHVWMFPDGKEWGYVGVDGDDTTVVTANETYDNVQSCDFYAMYPKSAHWAYSIRVSDDEEIIVVDGKAYTGYVNFKGLNLGASSRHWAFEAEKRSDSGDHPVIVVDGKEYLGEGLLTNSLNDKEYFLWSVKDGAKTTTQTLELP